MSIRRLEEEYLISPKVLYLLTGLYVFVLHQFRAIFAQDRFSIRKDSWGRGMGIIQFVTFFTNMQIAMASDVFVCPRVLMCGAIVLSALVFQSFYFSWVEDHGPCAFWAAMAVYVALTSVLMPILDSVTVEYLSSVRGVDKRIYGRQRLWGTIGYVLACTITESLVRRGDNKFDFDALPAYNLLVGAMTAVAITLFAGGGRGVRNSGGDSGNARRRRDTLRRIRVLLSNRNYLFFILFVLLNGICRSSMTIYLSVYQVKVLEIRGYDLGGSGLPPFVLAPIQMFNRNPMATVAIFASVTEVVIFFFSGELTTALGLYWPLLISQLAAILRFVMYFIVDPGWRHAFPYSCVAESLKGVNFGMTHMAGVQLAATLCDPESKATSQVFYNGVFTGVAGLLAGPIFSSVFHDGGVDDGDTAKNARLFRDFYMLNIVISSVAVAMFLVKYGLVDGVLFGRGGSTESGSPVGDERPARPDAPPARTRRVSAETRE